jgi:protein O-GlcNAc transferase
MKFMENFELAKNLFIDGLSCLENDNFEEAEIKFRQSLELVPDRLSTLINLSATLIKLRKFSLAKEVSFKAISLDQNTPEPWQNLGLIERAIHNYPEAIKYFDKAFLLNGNYAQVLCMKGATLAHLKRHEEALEFLEKAIVCKPDYPDAWIFKGDVLRDIGNIDGALESYQRAIEIKPDDMCAYGNLLFTLNYITGQTPESRLVQAHQFGRIAAKKAGFRYSSWLCDIRPTRLRVGLVSGDLLNHPVGYFLESLMSHIDPARVELIAYTTNHEQDALTARIRPYFSDWKPLYGKTDAAAARLIHSDGVHILLDLSGHTSHNRLPIFAMKPAPVQASWMGYLATTGVAEIDYLIADPVGVPETQRKFFTEYVWYLPDSVLCFSPPDTDLPVTSLPALVSGHVTFGCFQNIAKVSDMILATWSHILAALPNSRLRWQCHQFKDQTLVKHMLSRLQQYGIDISRVQLLGSVPRDEYLSSFSEVDIILDTFPYAGCTTTCEALWMGVPTLTLAGDTFLSRQGASLLTAAGLDDWITTSSEGYVDKALELAVDLPKLASLRADLREQVKLSPLFDASCFARNFEDALWGMWKQCKYSK